MAEIPEYVGYANALVKEVGESLERTLKDAVAEMATKSDLQLIEERRQRDRQEFDALRAEVKADKEAAAAKARRVWGAFWTGLGTVVVGASGLIAAIINTHH